MVISRMVLALAALCGAAVAAGQAPIEYLPGKEKCLVANTALGESSGVACSRLYPGVFYSHNDSGDRARVFAFDEDGKDLGVFLIKAAAADWEDMASAKIGAKSYLFFADVGDNDCKRAQYAVYYCEEPPIVRNLPPGAKPPAPPPLAAQTVHFTYADGKHNCESLAVDPLTGALYLVSKDGGNKCTVYELPSPFRGDAAARNKAVAQPIADLAIPTTTGADISADGLRAVICTYGDAYEYTRTAATEAWADAFKRPPRQIRLPARKQGESICFGPDGRTLYLTSEVPKNSGGACPLFVVPVKGP
jgi:hypothetical protein